MDKTMIADLRQKLIAIFDQVSEPLYYQGEGPYFMATLEDGDDVRFYFYEMNDVESFLADPEKMPAVFSEPDFMFASADTMDLAKLEHTGRYYSLFLMRLAPDSPVCRQAIKQIHEQNPDLLVNIALINELGNITPAVTLVDSPILFS